MEKLLEFKKDKGGGENVKYYRFQCACLSPADAMDITVDSHGQDEAIKFFTITMHLLGTGFWDRVKYAFQIIQGHWTWREFIVREEDTKYLSDIFNTEKRYSELP